MSKGVIHLKKVVKEQLKKTFGIPIIHVAEPMAIIPLKARFFGGQFLVYSSQNPAVDKIIQNTEYKSRTCQGFKLNGVIGLYWLPSHLLENAYESLLIGGVGGYSLDTCRQQWDSLDNGLWVIVEIEGVWKCSFTLHNPVDHKILDIFPMGWV